MAVVADQGVGAPLGHHLTIGMCQDITQPGQGGADIGIGVMADEPADGTEIGDRSQLGQGSFDREGRSRIDEHPVRTVGDEIGMALKMVLRQPNAHPPHARCNLHGFLLRRRCAVTGVRGRTFTGPMERTVHGDNGEGLSRRTRQCSLRSLDAGLRSFCFAPLLPEVTLAALKATDTFRYNLRRRDHDQSAHRFRPFVQQRIHGHRCGE
jgi:hypothetical protein